MNEKGFPLYQYSIFLNGSRDEQLVIRADTFEELVEAKKNIDKILTKRQNTPTTSQDAPQQTEDLGTCSKCGAANKLSKNGKPYCSSLCWK